MRLRASEITPEAVWRRRDLLVAAAALPLAGVAGGASATARPHEPPSTLEQITRYNNYYEFSSRKEVVWKLAEDFTPRPWTLAVEGEVERPRTWGLDDLARRFGQEERIYRMRCVEGWSVVVPWRGFALAALLADARPTSKARFVEFTSIVRPEEMVGQRTAGALRWPYTEALRIDEAMHPLTLVADGLYGRDLPSQNGAPLRLAVPWKYGFKSIKALARIRLVAEPPATSWSTAMPSEYGFWGNVNPDVPHPRWSQQRELRLGDLAKRATLPFNGYADQVAHLYAGMDLRRHP
jgi:methionine sulfoxide reductase catalytic subunit